MAKKLTKLNEVLRDIDGIEARDIDEKGEVVRKLTAGILLGRLLARGQAEDPTRAMDIALRIYNSTSSVVIDDDDVTFIEGIVTGDPAAATFTKAFLLKKLKAAQDVK